MCARQNGRKLFGRLGEKAEVSDVRPKECVGVLDRTDRSGETEGEIRREADVTAANKELPLRHREMIEHMEGEATELDSPIRDIAGTAVSEHKRVVGWGLAAITIVDK